MINVASLADCQALYKVSAWKGQYWWWVFQSDVNGDGHYVIASEHEAPFITSTYPAYDAAFLLAHLPSVSLTKHGNGEYVAAWADHTDTGMRVTRSRTNPANALCRLAVELFTHGVMRWE